MSLRAEFSLVNSEFNDFLFASVGEENSGLQLTVLSALSRLGFDPWGEAARLAALPREASAKALEAAIAMLPAGDWKVSDAGAIAARLVSRLPKRGEAPIVQPPQRGGDSDQKKKPQASLIWLICIALAAAGLFVMYSQYSERNAEPRPGAVSSTQR